MHAALVTGQGDPAKTEQEIAAWKALPVEPGWKGGYLVIDRKTGKFLVFSLWESEASAREYETSGRFKMEADAARAGGTQVFDREVFEVVAER